MRLVHLALFALVLGCSSPEEEDERPTDERELASELNNDAMRHHEFLAGMYEDGYFPDFLVDKVKGILLDLSRQIESQRPQEDAAFLALTHAATERINDLGDDFIEHDSELETVAREVIAEDFGRIADAYGFGHLNIEDLIATRDW